MPSGEIFGGNPADYDTNYLDHWMWMADHPEWVDSQFDDRQAQAFSNVARSNARNLAHLDNYLQETIEEYNDRVAVSGPQEAAEALDESSYLDAQQWYERLGSFNAMHGAERVTLNTVDILGSLATTASLDLVTREEMDIFSGTLYHELAVATAPHEPQFNQFAQEALSKYYDALYYPRTGRSKVDSWLNVQHDVKLTPERVKQAMKATARMHDLQFEVQRRRIFASLGGDLQVQARPMYVQRLQADARALHSLALTDLAKFLAINRRHQESGEWMLPNSFIYEWYVVAQIRTQQIVDKVGQAMLEGLATKQVRMAFPREDEPQDNMPRHRLPRLAFDMMTASYDERGQINTEPLPVQIKAQSRRFVERANKRYANRIYVLDRSDGDQPKDPKDNRTRELMADNVAGLQDELAVTPGDQRRIARLRERAHPFFQFTV